MKTQRPTCIFLPATFLALVFLTLILFIPNEGLAQSKPAPAKAKSSQASGSKPKSAVAKPVASKPAPTRTATGKPVTGNQAVTTKPAPPKSQATSTPATAPVNKTASTPSNTYRAEQNKAATPVATTSKRPTYGLAFDQNSKLLNVGLGLSSYYYGTPIGVSFEAGVHKDISVGGQLDYNSGRYGDYYYSSSRWGYKAYYIGVRGSYHFNHLLKIRSKKIDLYAGVGLGYQTFRWNDRSYGYGYNYGSGVFFNYFVGGKFYVAPKVAIFTELGYTGISSSRVGVAFKF